MDTTQWVINLLPSVGGLVAVYVKMNNDLTYLRSRVRVLEREGVDSKALLQEMHQDLQAIRVMLAKQGIE